MDNSKDIPRKMAVCNFKVRTVSNRELLLWYREKISPNLMSLNELGNGVDFCLGVDMMFPGVIGKRIIEVTETAEYFKRLNFRRLQAAFSKLNVKADVPINGLIKGSFKDLFNFGIWFKAFFEANCKSQPGDLNKVRSSHLKKWVKMKKQYELQKTKLYSKTVTHSNPTGSNTQLRHEDDCDSIANSSENNAVSNTDLTEVASGVQLHTDSPSELVSAGDNGQMILTKIMTPGKTRDSDTELFTDEYRNDISQTSISNNFKNITDDPNTNQNTDNDILKTESISNKDYLINPVTGRTLDTDPTPVSLKSSSFEEMVPASIVSEQINIELENNNINLREGLENLLREYNLLCNAVNDVKETVNEIKMDPDTDVLTENEFYAIKACCKRITNVINDVECQ